MKVKFGPYKAWVSPWDISSLLGYVGVSDERCDIIGDFLAKTWLADILDWIYARRERTVKVKIDKWDTWNLDHTLALIIAPCLKQLRATKHGVPSNLSNDDVPEELKCPEDKMIIYGREPVIVLPYSQKMWEWILDEMIWAFEYVIADAEDDDFEWTQEGQDRVDNGLRLFGKYYQNLWD